MKQWGFVLRLFFLSLIIQEVYAAELTDETINKISDNVTQLCTVASQRGNYWHVSTTADGRTVIKLVGIGGQATFSKGEWDGIKDVLPEHQVVDRASSRECVQKLVPLFLEKYSASGPQSSKQTEPSGGNPPKKIINLGQVQSGVLAKDTIHEYAFVGSANTPLLFTVEPAKGGLGYEVTIFRSGLTMRRPKGTCCANRMEVDFTPTMNGEYTVQLKGTQSYGRYKLMMQRLE